MISSGDQIDAETGRALKLSLREGMAAEALATLTGGAFLIAFALDLGASNFIIGILAGIPAFMQLLQLPSVYLIERVRRRKLLYTAGALLGRSQWLLIALVPLFFTGRWGLILFLIGFTIRGVFLSVANLSMITILRDVVPENRIGEFFSRRTRYAAAVSVVLGLVAGYFVDWWGSAVPQHAVYAYSILFTLGFLCGLVSIWFMTRIPEPVMTPSGRPFLALIRTPFQDQDFRRLLAFLGSWSFAVNLAVPFFTVYMLKRIGLDLWFVIFLGVLSQLVSLVFMEKWGAIADKFSNKAVLRVCVPAFLLCLLAWTFTTMPDRYFLTVPLLVVIHIVLGFATAGTSFASGNIVLKLAPKGEATSYLAARTMVNSLAAGIAPVIGGTFADFFAVRKFALTISWHSPVRDLELQALSFSHWDFFFFLAFILGYVSLRFLVRVREVGEVDKSRVINEMMIAMRRDLKNFSSIGGLFSLFFLPLEAMRNTMRTPGEEGGAGQPDDKLP